MNRRNSDEFFSYVYWQKGLLWRCSGFVVHHWKIKSNQRQMLHSQFPAVTQEDTGIHPGYHQSIAKQLTEREATVSGSEGTHTHLKTSTMKRLAMKWSTPLLYSLLLTVWTNMASFYLTALLSDVLLCFARCHHLSISRTSPPHSFTLTWADLSPVCIHVLYAGPRSVFH